MILDANDVMNGARVTADICVVGAGAAGIAIALSLLDSGLDVLVLESGGLEDERETQSLYEGTVEDPAMHSPPDRYRQRRLGGSTTIWGGRCMPFDPIDFDVRDYEAFSGWPIGLAELAPFYPQANALCEAGRFAYTAREAFPDGGRPMISGFEGRAFTTNTLERFSCPTDFGNRYRARLASARTVRVLCHANVTRMTLDAVGRSLENLEVKTLLGKSFQVHARRFVLAAGGLESVRLLLNSPGASGRGLGNQHDVVGRYYMCHLAGTIGTLSFREGVAVNHGYELSPDGVYCRRRFALRESVQQALRAGNFVARLHHPRMTDPAHRTGILSLLYLARFMIPYEYGKRLHGGEPIRLRSASAHLRNVVADAGGIVAFLWHWLRDRTLAARKFPSVIIHPRRPRYSLDFHAEQEPNPDSRVGLGAERDSLGLRRLHVDWRYSSQDVHTVQASLAALADDIRVSGVGAFQFEQSEVEREMLRYGAYGGHHIGTVRMGRDPRTSVVDPDCRVHEVANLYVAGSAVFPTSSQANPTLTIVALALRLAGHLRASTIDSAGKTAENPAKKEA